MRWPGLIAALVGGVWLTFGPAFAGTSAPDEAAQQAQVLDQLPAVRPPRVARPKLDRSGRKEAGKASFYSRKFDGRTMADGRRFDPKADVAASKTLPLGTTAKVTNEQTGKSAVVSVQDNGPHVDGRIIDVSPKVADQLAMKHAGVAPVVVKPITVPQADGSVRLGAGAAEAQPKVLEQAMQSTKRLAPDAAR